METVYDALEKYKDLKETLNIFCIDVKDALNEIRNEMKSLVKEHSDTKSEIKGLVKEVEWDRKEHEQLKKEYDVVHGTISKCPICNGTVDIEKLVDIANSANTKSTIAITLIVILIAALISHLTVGKP